MKKRLYLISYNFIPSARADGINRGYLCQALAKNNWDISVLTISNPYKFLKTYQEDKTLLSILPDSVKVIRVRSFDSLGLGEIFYLCRLFTCPYQFWARAVIKKLPGIFVEPGILYAIIPPISNALIALAAKQSFGFPLVLDFRDEYLHVEMLQRLSFEKKRFERLEETLVRAADLIIVATEEGRKTLIERYERYGISKQQVHVIYNGYGIVPADVKKTKRDNVFRVIYAGTISRFQQPEVLCRAARMLLNKHPEFRGRLAIDFYGPENYYVKSVLRRELGDGISFYGYLPLKEVLERLCEADVAYTSLSYDALSYALPSRVFYYIACEKPILASTPKGALANFIESQRIGISALPGNVESLYERLYLLINNPALIEDMKQNLSKIKSEYSLTVQAKRLSELLEPLTLS